MSNPRLTALKVLLKIEKDKAYSNIAVNNAIRESGLGRLDASFACAIIYGVIERQITLDYIIGQYSKIPLKKIDKTVKIILQMGIYQLLFMDKVPESAAVNESVKLAKVLKLYKFSGFVNGILRGITRSEEKYKLPDKQKNPVNYYKIKYSCPEKIVKLWIDSYGESNAEELLKNLSGRPEICARVNTLKTNRTVLKEALKTENVEAVDCPFPENAVYLKNTGSIENLSAFRDGMFHIQDASSQLCAYVLSPKPGQILLDVCSAPGGKSFTCAQYMDNTGKIYSCDCYEKRLNLVRNGAKRLGIENIVTVKRDASNPNDKLPVAERILCDVPCSGLGMMSRKPEIRYKDDITDNNLPKLQYKILCESARYLADGGRLVYSTCTLNPRENNEIAARFLKEHPDFYGISLDLPEGINRACAENSYEITLMPHVTKTDGFYIALFGKKVKA